MILKRPLAAALAGAMLAVPSIAVSAQDAAATATPAVTAVDTDNDDDGMDLAG